MMLRIFFAGFCIIFTITGEAEQLDTERQRELKALLFQDCGSCHGMKLTGGLGPSLQAEDINSKNDQYLIDIILNGKKQTPMPPWRQFLTLGEVKWIVGFLRQQKQ